MFKRQIRLLILSLSVLALALPMSAQAYKRCGDGCGKGGGVIYNETDGMYYNVPSKCRGMVYRSVDNRLVPVGKMHKTVVGVRCEMRAGHWWGYTWFPESKECWYMVR